MQNAVTNQENITHWEKGSIILIDITIATLIISIIHFH